MTPDIAIRRRLIHAIIFAMAVASMAVTAWLAPVLFMIPAVVALLAFGGIVHHGAWLNGFMAG